MVLFSAMVKLPGYLANQELPVRLVGQCGTVLMACPGTGWSGTTVLLLLMSTLIFSGACLKVRVLPFFQTGV